MTMNKKYMKSLKRGKIQWHKFLVSIQLEMCVCKTLCPKLWWPCIAYLVTRHVSIGLLVQEQKFKIDFQNGSHVGRIRFPIWTLLAIFDLQVTSILPMKFQVHWPFCWGEKNQNRFSKWLLWQLSWIFVWNDLSYSWSTSGRDTFYQDFGQLAFWVREKNFKIDFQDGSHGIHLSPIRMILSIFTYKSPWCFLQNFQTIGISIQEKKVQNRVSTWQLWWPSWTSDRNNFSYF